MRLHDFCAPAERPRLRVFPCCPLVVLSPHSFLSPPLPTPIPRPHHHRRRAGGQAGAGQGPGLLPPGAALPHAAPDCAGALQARLPHAGTRGGSAARARACGGGGPRPPPHPPPGPAAPPPAGGRLRGEPGGPRLRARGGGQRHPARTWWATSSAARLLPQPRRPLRLRRRRQPRRRPRPRPRLPTRPALLLSPRPRLARARTLATQLCTRCDRRLGSPLFVWT